MGGDSPPKVYPTIIPKYAPESSRKVKKEVKILEFFYIRRDYCTGNDECGNSRSMYCTHWRSDKFHFVDMFARNRAK